jgi:hypothetical protein
MLAATPLPHGLSANFLVVGYVVGRLRTVRYLAALLRRVLPVERQVLLLRSPPF